MQPASPWKNNKHVKPQDNATADRYESLLRELPDALNATPRDPGYLIATKKILLVLEILEGTRLSVRDVMENENLIRKVHELLVELGWKQAISRGTQVFVTHQDLIKPSIYRLMDLDETVIGYAKEITDNILLDRRFSVRVDGNDIRILPGDRSASNPFSLLSANVVSGWRKAIREYDKTVTGNLIGHLTVIGEDTMSCPLDLKLIFALLDYIGWPEMYLTGEQILLSNPMGDYQTLEVNYIDPE